MTRLRSWAKEVEPMSLYSSAAPTRDSVLDGSVDTPDRSSGGSACRDSGLHRMFRARLMHHFSRVPGRRKADRPVSLGPLTASRKQPGCGVRRTRKYIGHRCAERMAPVKNTCPRMLYEHKTGLPAQEAGPPGGKCGGRAFREILASR